MERRKVPLSHSPKGFSLVEMLMYIVLLVLILIALFSGIRLTLRAYTDTNNRLALTNSGRLAMDRIVREVRTGSAVNSGGSTFGSSPGALSLSSTDSSGNATTTVFNVSGGMLQVAQGSGSAVPLLAPSVGISSFTLYQITTSNSTGVRIVLVLQTATTTAHPLSATFYDTAVLRGSY